MYILIIAIAPLLSLMAHEILPSPCRLSLCQEKKNKEGCKLEVGKLMKDVVSVIACGSLSMCCNLFIANGLSMLNVMGVILFRC